MRLIDGNSLYKKTAEWESLAMETLKVQEDNAELQRWQTILGERTAFKHDVADAPTIDAISTDDVAEMLSEQFYDRCPCNYNNNDEWLPYVCELTDECPNPKDPLGCWKQYIKHYGRKPE